jgi:hypothetical protein
MIQQSLVDLYAESEKPAVLEFDFTDPLKISEVKAMLRNPAL